MKKGFRRIAVMAMAIFLVACATQGDPVRIQFTMPRGEVNTIVAHSQLAPDWAMSISDWKMNYLVKGDVTTEQLKAIAIVEKNCRLYAKTVQPNVAVTIVADAALVAAFTALGVGIGAHYLAKNIDESAYVRYGAAAGAGAGAATGVMSGGSIIYAIETCFRDVTNANANYGIKPLR